MIDKEKAPTRGHETKHHSFFSHTKCEYFPCHKVDDPSTFNCLFCYCPLYALGETCGGDVNYTKKGIKDCSACLRPHKADAAADILVEFKRIAELARKK